MSKRIGLLTLPLHFNYGGILQAAALYRVLTKDLDKEVVFLERDNRQWRMSLSSRALIGSLTHLPGLAAWRNRLVTVANWLPVGLRDKMLERVDIALRDQRIRTHQPFVDRYLPERTGKLGSTDEMAAAAQRFGLDTLVVGSDQVWRLDYFPSDAEEDYFFGFAPSPAIRKIAYAASFGHGTWTFPRHTARTKELVAQFDAVSVREASGVEICATVFDRRDAVHVIDPTLLVDPSFYQEIAGRRPTSSSKKAFLSYVLDVEPERQKLARDVQASLGPGYNHRSLTLDTGSKTIDIPEWLRAFMLADFVLTDSFHGTVFSIIFRKPFISIVNKNRGADRFLSLAGQLGLENRLIFSTDTTGLRQAALNPIDFSMVEKRLESLRRSSFDFLSEAVQVK